MHASQYAELSMRCCSIRRLNQTGCRASDKVAADLAETTQLLLEDLKRPRASIGKVWKHGYSNDFWCYEIIGPLQPFGELLNCATTLVAPLWLNRPNASQSLRASGVRIPVPTSSVPHHR